MDISKPRIVLLPQDREIMEITGLTAEQYRDFCVQCYKASRKVPSDQPTAFEPVTFIVTLIVGLALSYIATLLAPKPQLDEPEAERRIGGQRLTNGARSGPTSGFDSVQNVVEVGSLIPLVYANRREIGGTYYGGVRVNTNLLWSQLYSVGGGQLLRGVFLVGEGTIPEPDPDQYALGNNLINNYDLAAAPGDLTSRLSLYYVDGSEKDNRITQEDFIRGRQPAFDVGNAQADGGDDVFEARVDGTNWAPDFCYASTPSNQTEFGAYGFIGNNMPFRLSPSIRPTENYDNEPRKADAQGKSDRMRDVWRYYGRCGVHEVNGAEVTGLQNLSAGDTITYTLYNDSDAEGEFNYQVSGPDGFTSVKDVASSVASRQNGFDDQIQIGDRYLIGTAIGVCTARTNEQFTSEMANIPIGGGQPVTATFQITQEGQCHSYTAASLHPDPINVDPISYDIQDHTPFEVATPAANPGRVLIANSNFENGNSIRFQERGTSNLDSALALASKRESSAQGDIYGPYFVVNRTDTGFQVALSKGGAGLALNGDGGTGTANTPGAANVIRVSFVGDPNNEPEFAPDITATNATHLMRVAEGYFAVERSSRFIEVGLRSSVNLSMSGVTNYRDIADGNSVRTLTQVDEDKVDDNITFLSGTYTSPETRYSCFRVSYRADGSENYQVFPQIFAVRSMMDTPVYNYLRFDMATAQSWEFKFTPVPSYETRNSAQQINVLDYKLDNQVTATDGSITIAFSGVSNLARGTSEDARNFAVPILTTIDGNRLSDNSGPDLDFDDRIDGGGRRYFSDAYARLAEFFMHNELRTTANNPEHSIVYINTQTTNEVAPNYSNLAMVGMNIRSSKEISQLQQFSVYCNQGIGSTNLFPEVLLDLLTNQRYGVGGILNAEQIDQASFAEMATWCENRNYYFDGVIEQKVNIRQWGTEVANNYLLDLVVRNGKFALQPKVDFDNNPVVTALFTAGNIISDTFQFTSSDEQNRVLPRVSVRWREEKADTENGLFPVVRQVTVKEQSTPEDAPLESVDVSDYCTSERQAIDLGKWLCRQRRLVTHSITFETTPTEAALDIGSVFKLGMESVTYNQPQNGAIASNGEVTAWPPIDDGTYDVLIYDGGDAIIESTLVIADGKSTRRNCVFCLRTGASQAETYKTQALSYTEDGNIAVEATVYPCNTSGASLITEGWDDASNWDIEGQRT